MSENKNKKIFVAAADGCTEVASSIGQDLNDSGYNVVQRGDLSNDEYSSLMLAGGGASEYMAIIANVTQYSEHNSLPVVTYNMRDNLTLDEHADAVIEKLKDLGITPNNKVAADEKGHGGTVKDVKQQKISNALY